MALFYGSELNRRLKDAGVKEDVCMVSKAIYDELRFLWQEIAQRIGMAVGMLRELRRTMPEEWSSLNPIISGSLITLMDDEIRHQYFTHPLKDFMEAVYDGGYKSAGGLSLMAYVCDFTVDAEFLRTRKSFESSFYRASSLIMDACHTANRYLVNSINSIVALAEDLNDIVGEVAGDVLKKPLFDLGEIQHFADRAINGVLYMCSEMDVLREPLRGG